jgi:hypothetical protein
LLTGFPLLALFTGLPLLALFTGFPLLALLTGFPLLALFTGLPLLAVFPLLALFPLLSRLFAIGIDVGFATIVLITEIIIIHIGRRLLLIVGLDVASGQGIENALVMVSVLVAVLRQHAIPLRGRVPGHRQVFFHQLLGVPTHPYSRTIAIENLVPIGRAFTVHIAIGTAAGTTSVVRIFHGAVKSLW